MSLLIERADDREHGILITRGRVQGEIRRTGATVMVPAKMLGNALSRANEQLAGHRNWLANLHLEVDGVSQSTPGLYENGESPTPTLPVAVPTRSHLPSLQVRAPQVTAASAEGLSIPGLNGLDCDSSVASASRALQASAAASIFAISSSAARSVLAAQSSAQVAITSAQSSAAAALAAASSSALLAASSITQASIIVNSATSAQSSAQSSASSAIATVQASASSALESANSAVISLQASASAAVESANQAASDAQNSAGLEIQQASASISAISSQATKNIFAARSAAGSSTLIFALVVIFSSIGSAMAAILIYFLCARYRRKRREQKMGLTTPGLSNGSQEMYKRGLEYPVSRYGGYGGIPYDERKEERRVMDNFPMPPQAPISGISKSKKVVDVPLEDSPSRNRQRERERYTTMPLPAPPKLKTAPQMTSATR